MAEARAAGTRAREADIPTTPANGVTAALTPGRNRLRKMAATPQRAYASSRAVITPGGTSLRPRPSRKKAAWWRAKWYMPTEEAVLASQHRRPRGTTHTSPRRAKNAPRGTATSAGPGGETFPSPEGTIPTREGGAPGKRADPARNGSSTRERLGAAV